MEFGEYLFYLILAIGALWGIYIFFSMLESFSGTPSGERYDDPRGIFEWGSLPNYLLILFILCLLAFVCFGGQAAGMNRLTWTDAWQVIIAIILLVGLLFSYYHSFWKDPYDRYVTKELTKERLLGLLFIAFLMWPVSCIVNFFD